MTHARRARPSLLPLAPGLASVLAAACASASCAQPGSGDAGAAPSQGAPPGWFVSGGDPSRFRATADRTDSHAGDQSGRLAAIGPDVAGAATLMQSIAAGRYRGGRLRFSAALRTERVERWAGLWMRVDRAGGGSLFDNMQDRPVRGTTGWSRYEIVLEVPDDATAIHFGLLQDGPGESRIDSARLEPAGPGAAVTDIDRRPRALENGGFEAGQEAPDGWLRSGFGQEDVAIALDRDERHGGAASARLRGRVPDPRGRALLVQSIRADDYRGRRLRASAWLRGQDATRAAFMLRVATADVDDGSEGLSRGGCEHQGTFAWQRCDAVFDVPERGRTIHVTAFLEGRGTLWVDDVSLAEVGPDVPVTWVDGRPRLPANGDLEAGDDGGVPAGWFLSGGALRHYQAVVDSAVAHGGRASARLSPVVESPLGYGTLMQLVRAADHRGRRMRLIASVRGRGIEGRGDLWLRVQGEESPADGPGLGGGLRRLAGSFDWQTHALVFDVPPGADAIQWGVGLAGRGTIWVDDVRLEAVGPEVPLERGDAPASALENGGFEDRPDRPAGWFLSGSGSGDFEALVDRGERAAGAASASLRARGSAPRGYGTLMQAVRAGPYRGKRLRLRASLMRRGDGPGDFWLRVQAAGSPADGPGLSGGSCPIPRDRGWAPCEILFDVPGGGETIQFGAGLAGPGAIWLDQVSLEEIGPAAPTTSAARSPDEPANLDFESRP